MSRNSQLPLKLAIAYLRVSTDKQAQEGDGHELQLIAIQAFARANGYRIRSVFTDAASAMGEDSIRERTGANEAIKLSRAKGYPILVDGLDRFSRNTRTVEEHVIQGRLKVISCRTGEGASNAVILSQAARGERHGQVISETTKLGLQKAKERGVLLGNRTNLDEAQKRGAAATKARADERAHTMTPVIQELRGAGRTTARAIAEGLNMKGLRTPQGKEWTAGNVRVLLERVAVHEQPLERRENVENDEWGRW